MYIFVRDVLDEKSAVKPLQKICATVEATHLKGCVSVDFGSTTQ